MSFPYLQGSVILNCWIVPLSTRSSCHPAWHRPITFPAALTTLQILGEPILSCGCEWRTRHLSASRFKSPIWSFLLFDDTLTSLHPAASQPDRLAAVSLLGESEIATNSTSFNRPELETIHGAGRRKSGRMRLNLDKMEWLKLLEAYVLSLSFSQFLTALITVPAMACCPRRATHYPN